MQLMRLGVVALPMAAIVGCQPITHVYLPQATPEQSLTADRRPPAAIASEVKITKLSNNQCTIEALTPIKWGEGQVADVLEVQASAIPKAGIRAIRMRLSPWPQYWYCGEVALDASGFVWVTLRGTDSPGPFRIASGEVHRR